MKKIILLAMIAINAVFATITHAAAIFAVEPGAVTTNIKSNASGIVTFFVTNNSNQTISNITVDPFYNATAKISGLSLKNNSCTGSSLRPFNLTSDHCQFSIVINGNDQPTNFIVSPRVCGFNGAVCSTPTVDNRTKITINAATSTPYAYFTVGDDGSGLSTQLVPVNAQTLQLGTPVSLYFNFAINAGNGIAVSPDGSTVFAPQSGTGPQLFTVLSGGSTPQVINSIPTNVDNTFNDVAVSPDGSTVYVTTFDNIVYVYTKSGNTFSYAATIADSALSSENLEGITVTPDGRSVLVTSYFNNKIAVIDTQTQKVTRVIDDPNCNFQFSESIVTADGVTAYVSNTDNTTGWISVVDLKTGLCDFPVKTITGSSFDAIASLAISNDGRYLYSTYGSGLGDTLSVVDTQNNYAITTYTIAGAQLYGAALTPDNSKLFLSNTAGNNAYAYTLVNGLPSAAPVAIALGGPQLTTSNFVG